MTKKLLISVAALYGACVFAHDTKVPAHHTLQLAVQHAMVANPDLLFNRAKSLAAEQAIKKVEGANYPSIDLSTGIGREKTNNPVTNNIGGASSNEPMTRKEFSAELRQNLFSGFAISGEIDRHKYLWQAQEFKTLGVAEDLSLSVTEKFLEVIKQQQLLMLAVDNLHEHERVLSMIEHRSGAGVSRQAELEQAKGRLALAKANEISVRNDLRDARISYTKVVGERPIHLQWPKVPKTKDLPKNIHSALQLGIDNHPTLLSAYADIKEAKAQYKVAKAADYPKIDLILSTQQNNNTDGLVGQNTDKLAVVRLKHNLFRGGSDLARKRETAYQVQEAFEVKNNTVLQVEESVRLSWYAWITAGNRLSYLKQHVNAAIETKNAYGEQFKVGKRTLLDLLDSQNELYQAKLDEQKGIFDEVYARYRILNSTGALFKFLNARLPISVHNNDLATSHERMNHHWLNKPVGSVPDVDLSNSNLKAPDYSHLKNKASTRKTLMQTTEKPKPVLNANWIIFAQKLSSLKAANALKTKLQKLDMKNATIVKSKEGFWWVLLGPYEYRAQAAMGMKQLHQRAGLHGSIVHIEKKAST